MDSMKNSLLFLLLTISLIGCSQKKNQEIKLIVDEHSSRMSVDWVGTYEGTMPCADCSGIETMLTISEDNSYIITQSYQGKGGQIFEEKGLFQWDETGSIITLQREGEESKFHQYRVGENVLFKLDSNGNRINGDLSEFYILKKIEI